MAHDPISFTHCNYRNIADPTRRSSSRGLVKRCCAGAPLPTLSPEARMLELIGNIHWAAVLQIIVIDILLGGDNAVVIALACRRLPPKQRMQGVLWGTAGAVVMRLIFVGFAVYLLGIPYLKIVGGVLLLWIGTRL